MTHEIRNILAILKESSGLISDILSLNKDSSFPHREKMESSLSRIQAQIPRGMDLLTQFNRLAHSVDESDVQIEINDFLDHVITLMECFARLKKVELKILPADAPISFKTDPFPFHWMIASCIDYVLREAPEGSAIKISTRKEKKNLKVHISIGANDEKEITSSDIKDTLPQELAYLEPSLKALRSRIFVIDALESKGILVDIEI